MKERRKGKKGEGREEELLFTKKKKNLFSYTATYMVLIVLPQMYFLM